MEELKPCPFCGGESSPNGVIRRSSSPDCRWRDGTECLEAFYCNRMRCGAKNGGIAGGYQTKQEAIDRWNRRAHDAKLVEALKHVRSHVLTACEPVSRESAEMTVSAYRVYAELEAVDKALREAGAMQ